MQQHAPYQKTSGHDLFQVFISTLLHQYYDNTQHDTDQIDSDIQLSYQHTILELRSHHSITSDGIDWDQLRPTMTPNSTYYLAYTL